MTDQQRNEPAAPTRAPSSGIGCLLGLGVAIAVPVVVFCGILIANAINPQCGTPADSGGCEMGLAAGTIGAIVIGLALGIVVAIAMSGAGRPMRK